MPEPNWRFEWPMRVMWGGSVKGEKGRVRRPKNRKKTAEKILVSFLFQKAVFETFSAGGSRGPFPAFRRMQEREGCTVNYTTRWHWRAGCTVNYTTRWHWRAGCTAPAAWQGKGAPKNGRATVTRDELATTVEAVMP